MKKIGLMMAATMAATMMGAAAQATTVYTDQTSFTSANPVRTLTTFDSYTADAAANGGLVFVSDPLTQGPVTFTGPEPGGPDQYGNPSDLYVTTGNFFPDRGFGFSDYTTALSTDPYDASITLSFSPLNAIGLNLASAYGGNGPGPVEFDLFSGQTEVYTGTFQVGDLSTPSFVGFSGPGLTSLVVTAKGNNAFDTFINVQTVADASQVSAAPEPGVWALMLAGVAMIGLTLRQGLRQRGAAMA